MLGLALATFHWDEERFWAATPHAFLAACSAHRLMHDPDYRKREAFARFKAQFEG